jgi:uncharacterized DUF497 family protein
MKRPTHLYGQISLLGAQSVQGFDWDEGNREKCERHGLTIAEIEAVFADRPQIIPDLKHSIVETRAVAFGTVNGRPAFVGFTVRERDGLMLVRPVTARYMHAKEARRYEQDRS